MLRERERERDTHTEKEEIQIQKDMKPLLFFVVNSLLRTEFLYISRFISGTLDRSAKSQYVIIHGIVYLINFIKIQMFLFNFNFNMWIWIETRPIFLIAMYLCCSCVNEKKKQTAHGYRKISNYSVPFFLIAKLDLIMPIHLIPFNIIIFCLRHLFHSSYFHSGLICRFFLSFSLYIYFGQIEK